MLYTLERKVLLGILVIAFFALFLTLIWLSSKEDYDTAHGIHVTTTNTWIKRVEYALGILVLLFLGIIGY